MKRLVPAMSQLAAYLHSRPARRWRLLRWTLFLGGFLTGAEIDMFAPGLPQMQEHFALSAFTLEWCVSGNLLACCATCLVVGRLADSRGRRPVVLTGLIIFVMGSLLCALAPHFAGLLVGRLLQGVGMASLGVLSQVLLVETCTPEEQPRVMGLVNGATTLAISAAPMLGSWLVQWGGWRTPFLTLLGLGLTVLALMTCSLPTKPESGAPVRARAPVELSRELLLSGLALAFLTAPYWVFVGLAPLLYIQGMGVPVTRFGWYQGVLATVFGTVSLLTSAIVRWLGNGVAQRVSRVACAVAACGMVGCAYLGASAGVITATVAIYSAGAVVPYVALYPRFLRAARAGQSQAAAALLCVRFVTTTAALQWVAWGWDATFVRLAWLMAGGIAIALWAMVRLGPDGLAVSGREIR